MTAILSRLRCCLLAWCLLALAGDLAGQQRNRQQGTRWNIEAEPQIGIGEAFGPDAYLFRSIVSARFLPDGRVVVADGGFFDVRIFAANGTFQKRFGRSGQGPGEFLAISALWLTSKGMIAVWDTGIRRVSLFSAQGALASTHRVRGVPEGGNLEVFVGWFGNDDIVLGSLFHGKTGPGSPALVPDRVVLGRFGLDGEYKGPLGELDGLLRFRRNPVPFSPVPVAVLIRDSIYVADGYQGRISARGARGVPARTIVLPAMNEVSADAAWSFLEAQLRERQNTLFLEILQRDAVPRDKRLPQIGGLLADDQGNLWVKAYDPYKDSIWLKGTNAAWPARGGEWRVMRTDGTPVAVVQLPELVRPLEIKGNRLLGVATDSLGVERIVIHGIQRQPTDTSN